MWYGWTGVGLEVDLSQKRIKKSPGDKELYQNYLGGHALLTKMFWDRVPPEVEPFSPDNLLIFGAGPLVGTPGPAACRTCLVTKSPLTNYLFDSNMAGFWGAELKFAGYDTLTISGKSDTPVYIYINNDKVEIRDASHLWGKDVYQTQRLIRKELKDDKIQSVSIGIAGENRVYFADISHGPGCSLSRCGTGAVMGDKKLKAIAIRGNKNVNIARPAPFLEVCENVMGRSAFVESAAASHWPNPEGTLYLNAPHNWMLSKGTMYRNFDAPKPWQEIEKSYLDFLAERQALMVACFNCQVPCIHAIHLTNGETVFWKCQARHYFMSTGDVQNFDYSLRCFSLIQRHGMDIYGASNLCRFAIDLFQKGILSKEDTDGMVLEWGNPETVPALLEKIARREGLGDILANGVYQAAQQIGRGAEQHAYNLRRLEIRGSRYAVGLVAAIRELIGDRQGDFRMGGNVFGHNELLQKLTDPEEIRKLKDILSTGSRQMPGEPKKENPEIDGQTLGKLLAYDFENAMLTDSCGICRHRFTKDNNLLRIGYTFEADLVSHATGLDMSQEALRKCTRRARAITRAYNSILGERMNADELNAHLLSPKLLADNRSLLHRLLSEANRAMGYSADGIPSKEHLEELGLNDVARELERRGILPEPDAIPQLVSTPG